MTTARDQARAARAAARTLVAAGPDARRGALHRVADALVARQDELLAANALDVADAEAAVAAGTLSQALADRLPLTPSKIATLADGLRSIADAPDPVGRLLEARELADGLVLEKRTSPLGVLLVIFEARPDALPQIAGLALASGNGLVLKGGREASRSNVALHRVIQDALSPEVDPAVVALVQTRDEVADLLALDDVIDLVIPRGSNALVRHVQDNTRIPVLGHADGVCHVVVDASADPDTAERIVVDSKTDYPAACNAMETLLVHRSLASTLAPRLFGALEAAGVVLHAIPSQADALGLPPAPALHHEYGDLACTVGFVDDLDAAIAHVHAHGSGHTEAIVAEDADVAERFLAQVDSACVFWNASTRFADGYRFGLGAEVGISTSRIHARGPVGVGGLLTSRWLLRGHGQTVGDVKAGTVRFTHRALD